MACLAVPLVTLYLSAIIRSAGSIFSSFNFVDDITFNLIIKWNWYIFINHQINS